MSRAGISVALVAVDLPREGGLATSQCLEHHVLVATLWCAWCHCQS